VSRPALRGLRHVQPELRINAEGESEAHRGVGGDGPLSGAKLVDAPLLHAYRLRHAVAGDAQRLEELGEQNVPGMHCAGLSVGRDVLVVLRPQFAALATHVLHPLLSASSTSSALPSFQRKQMRNWMSTR
jgi:hypothetical protein